ncbi:MAG: SH3 domain-containing protein [Legionellaceae bacterium]|nr:SH3 domain-containing protein [Legionellaceae bacterium]
MLFCFKFKNIYATLFLGLITCSLTSFAVNIPREYFQIEAYSQEASDYISPESPGYTKNLLTPDYQKLRLKQFYTHYYLSDSKGLSPWSRSMVNAIFPVVKKAERAVQISFSSCKKEGVRKHYAENFREHDKAWWRALQNNLNLNALDGAVFQEKNRAIAVHNTFARVMPSDEPDFFNERVPGEGFPFDNFQVASVWSGTPLYILNISKDKAWSLVLTPDAYFAWVKSSDIASASPDFIKQWQEAAQRQLVAITQTKVSILDERQQFQLSGYIGAVFPLMKRDGERVSILIPSKNTHHQAVIKKGFIKQQAVAFMPLTASPEHMVKLIQQLQHRSYGWGGAFFLNDCSQELKSLFTPFGIWLPRNSGLQAKLNKKIDLSACTLDERLRVLRAEGHPLMSLIYKPGHIMLYVGNAKINHHIEAITYQNVWGVSPKNGETRYVIGGAVFLPILSFYPKNPQANTQANESTFKLIHLDEQAVNLMSPAQFSESFK